MTILPAAPAEKPARLRHVLEGVPRVSFFAPPGQDAETCPFPSCVRACLDYLGDGLGQQAIEWQGRAWTQNTTYTFVMGVTGAAFRLSWRPGWHGDNVEIMYLSDDPEAPFRRAMTALGYGYEFLFPQPWRDTSAYWREEIIKSIDHGRPVLGFGVVGPPECCLITGYDEGGEVLVGWSFFQDFPQFNTGVEFEPSGYFRKRDWAKGLETPMILGAKGERPPLRPIYADALRWAVQVARTPLITRYGAPRHNGLAAYDAWAQALLDETLFPPLGPAGPRDEDLPAWMECFNVHEDAVGTVAEGRWYAAYFLQHAAREEPVWAARVMAAADCYRDEHDLMWEVWKLEGGLQRSPEQMRRWADPAVRRQIVALIERARARDEVAAVELEKCVDL